jgi:hypothetical protein
MSHLTSLRDALFDLVNEVDVEEATGDEWQFAYKHPVKQPDGYPGFCVHPARNQTRVIDSATNEGLYTFWVDLFYTFEDAAAGEDKLITLADVVYDTLLENLKSIEPLDGASFDGDPFGSWGSTQDMGERFYRIEVTARVLQEFDLP